MKEFQLKYGMNPNQKPAKIYMENDDELPIQILNGKPGYINFLDAFNSYQLVKELKEALNLPAAASFKHVSPAGVAVGLELTETLKKIYWIDEKTELSPLACAYIRARGTDRMSSFGDFIALSDKCDVQTAEFIRYEVSDGIIAPDYDEAALKILKQKKNGNYNIIKIDENYIPEEIEKKQVFGITFEQGRNNIKIDKTTFSNIVTKNKTLTKEAVRDLIIALITLKYTQSNSVCYAKDGQTIGVGAGQQSRIHCTRLAGDKADMFHLRMHPKVIALKFCDNIKKPDKDNAVNIYTSNESDYILKDGIWQNIFKTKPEKLTDKEKSEWLSSFNDIALGSDAFFPFSDNIERAIKSGVKYIAAPGGSKRDDIVINSCNEHNLVMSFIQTRLFHH